VFTVNKIETVLPRQSETHDGMIIGSDTFMLIMLKPGFVISMF